eukprot:3387952-Rhodomonas_salina.1
MQSMLCGAFIGADSYITGGEHGSLYLWQGPEMLWAAPTHHGAVTDLSLDCLDAELGLLHVISGGFDGTVCVSSCQDLQIVRLRTIEMPAGPQGGPVAVVSVANMWGRQKASGFLHTHWPDSPPDANSARAPLSRAPPGAELHAAEGEEYAVLVGTVSNCVYQVDLASGSVRCEVEGPEHGRIGAVCVHPTESHWFVTAGEDGVVRLWDAEARKLVRQQRLEEAALSADVSADGYLIVLAFASGGFSLLNARTLQPLRYVIKEFDVLVLGKGGVDRLTLSRGPETQQSKNMNRRRDACMAKAESLARKSEIFGLSPEEKRTLEEAASEAEALTERVSARQQSLFVGHTLVAEARVELARQRQAVEELEDQRRQRGFLDDKQQSDLRAELQISAA